MSRCGLDFFFATYNFYMRGLIGHFCFHLNDSVILNNNLFLNVSKIWAIILKLFNFDMLEFFIEFEV
jgi:hypothetical protein